MTKVIVTGGAGFIGSHLVDALVELGHQVIVIDDFSTGDIGNLKKNKDKITIFNQGLSLESELLKKIPDSLTGTSFIYHTAALARIERSIDDPISTHNANVNGTLAALELGRKLKVKRFIFTSTSSIYGDQKVLPLKESLNPNPQNPYAMQKLIGEYYCNLYVTLYNMPVIIFRLFNVYGSRMSSKGGYKLVFTKWLEQIKNKEPLSIFGSGKQTRDFTYISDIIDGLIKGMDVREKIICETINLGYGREISVEYLAKLFNHSVKKFPERKYEEKFKQADINKAKKILNWKPKVSIEEGVKKLLKDYKYQ